MRMSKRLGRAADVVICAAELYNRLTENRPAMDDPAQLARDFIVVIEAATERWSPVR